MEQEKDIDLIKGEKTVDMLMARIVHELNEIDPRFRFYMESRSGMFVANYYHKRDVLSRAIKVGSSRLAVMYSSRWISEPYLAGARSFFEEVRRTHPVDLNELTPMHIAPNLYWRQNSSQEDAEEIEISNSLAIKLGIPLQNTTFGIWKFSPENLKKLGDYMDLSFVK